MNGASFLWITFVRRVFLERFPRAERCDGYHKEWDAF